jgi:Integrase core domain
VASVIAQLSARHPFIKPHCRWQNGKVERYNRTLQTEWSYRRVFKSNADRVRSLAPWLEFHNTQRRHSALDGVPPISRLWPDAGVDFHRCRDRPGRSAVVRASQIPVHNDTKGMGAQMPTEKYGVRSPFHAGGGGGGGGGSGAATQLFEGTSYTVPTPHSTALALPGDTSVRDASGARIAATTIVR